MYILKSPSAGEIVSQQTKEQKELLEKYLLAADKAGGYEEADTAEDAELIKDWLKILMTPDLDFSSPEKICFRWEKTDKKSRSRHSGFFIELSENAFFRKKMIFKRENRGKNIYAHSLKTGTKYFWRLGFTDEKGHVKYTAVSFFFTEKSFPRWMEIEGASNVRDVGGCVSLYGGRIRQGLLYRGCALNKRIEATRKGLDFLRQNLFLKSDLDIRGNDGESGRVYPLKQVRYFNIPLRAYGNIFSQEQLENYAKCFKVLLDKRNLPSYCHCLGGADRTGCFVFLFCAVLGMEEKDLLFDYEATSVFSFFRGKRYRSTAYFQSFLQNLRELAGDAEGKKSIHELAENYFRKGGITEKELKKARKIFLEKEGI